MTGTAFGLAHKYIEPTDLLRSHRLLIASHVPIKRTIHRCQGTHISGQCIFDIGSGYGIAPISLLIRFTEDFIFCIRSYNMLKCSAHLSRIGNHIMHLVFEKSNAAVQELHGLISRIQQGGCIAQ
ncbi:hypothetical protein D3C72_1162690 [compost metagenome]